MPKHYKELLKHILDECQFIQQAVPESMYKNELIENETLKRDVVKNKIPSLTNQIIKVLKENH